LGAGGVFFFVVAGSLTGRAVGAVAGMA